jgi:hypothetical protein
MIMYIEYIWLDSLLLAKTNGKQTKLPFYIYSYQHFFGMGFNIIQVQTLGIDSESRQHIAKSM